MPIKQENRAYKVDVPSKPGFELMSFEGTEYVSAPFEFTITMRHEGNVDPEKLLRKDLILTIVREEGMGERVIHGQIRSARLIAKGKNILEGGFWEVKVVPRLWFLHLESTCRHFQNMTAMDIIQYILNENGINHMAKIQGSLPKREFTVQYRESTFNFISRLLEEEGIFYWFDHTKSGHNLILSNNNSATQDCPVLPKLAYGLGMVSGGGSGQVSDMYYATSAHTGKISLQDFNFEMSSVNLLSSTAGKQESEVFDYPGRYSNKSDGEYYAKLRLEEQEARLRTIEAETLSTTLMAGYRFTLTNHFDQACNTSYIVLQQSLKAVQNVAGNGGEGDVEVESAFRAIPYSVPYRPPRIHPKPIIPGIQTATVVGGGDIDCDEYGRVKVKFHWVNQSHSSSQDASFWIRVSSAWAGAEWGQISLPRVGQEVIISFLEGDPDRPVITGRVYNDLNMPPYTLPANASQSGVKSDSVDGSGFNEFRFEDKSGKEEIYLHAQRDFNAEIEDTRTETVRRGNRTVTLEQGDQLLECKMGKIAETSPSEIKMTVGGSSITITPSKIELTIGGSTITMNPTNIKITAGAASIDHGPAMTSVSAAMIKLN